MGVKMMATPISGSFGTVSKVDPKAGLYEDKSNVAKKLQEDFLTMLTAQLEYQDPLKPLENAEFTSQVAQITGLQQQATGNTLLEQLIAGQKTDQLNVAVGYLGQNVVVDGDRFNMNDGKGSVNFQLSGPATASITVYDIHGQPVKWMDAQLFEPGEHTVDISDSDLDDGVYSYSVNLKEASDSTTVQTYESGAVTGVVRMDDGVMLDLNGRKVEISRIRRVDRVGA